MLDLIFKIEQANKRADKIDLLKQVDPQWLYMAMSPMVRFYIAVPDVVGRGVGQCDDTGLRLLALLSTRNLTGNKAVDLVRAYLQSRTCTHADLFTRVLRKDLRCGVGPKVINMAHPGLIEESYVMLAEPYDPARVQFPVWVAPKLDGNRGLYVEGEFFSRSGKVITGLDHLIRGLRARGMRGPLDGELKDPTTTFQIGSGRIRGKKTAKQDVCFYVFDIPSDKPANARIAELDFTAFPQGVHRVPHYVVHTLNEVERYYHRMLDAGFEGAMVKSYGHRYVRGRSFHWMKMKVNDMVDAPVTDLIEGEGKYVGSLGAVVVDFNGNSVKVSPAIPDSERQRYWDDPNLLLGKTIEVMYQEKTDGGTSLRHPRFRIVRHDK